MKFITTLFFIVFLSGMAQAGGDKHFFVFLNTNPQAEKLDSAVSMDLQAKHLANITRLHHLGFIKAAGPFERGGGIFIFKASSLKAVKDSLQTDPAIAANRYILETYPMTILKGKLCDVGEEYDMTTYPTVRLLARDKAPKPIPEKMSEENMKPWFDVIEKQADIIFAARFDDENGGGFVVTNPKRKNQTELSVTLQSNNIFTSKIRNLWIAMGTFCETK
jgi:uncharacterized protein YciI